MRRLYRILLLFYPEAYRNDLSQEMLAVFERLLGEQANRGTFARFRFAMREIAGLVFGFSVQRLRPRPAFVAKSLGLLADAEALNRPSNLNEIAEAEECVRFHLVQVIECIANHRFEGARFHAREEERARERLSLLQHSS
jgi:hypothetical protein